MNKPTAIKRFKGHKLTKTGAARWAFIGKDKTHKFHTLAEALGFIEARVKSNVRIAA